MRKVTRQIWVFCIWKWLISIYMMINPLSHRCKNFTKPGQLRGDLDNNSFQTLQGECFLNERQHRDMKIARDDSAAKLGNSDWCDFPLNASERISEQALIFHSKGGRCSFWGLLYCYDRRSPWWASRDGLQHDHIHSDTVMTTMNFNSCASLVIFFIIPVCSVLFLNTELYILYEC